MVLASDYVNYDLQCSYQPCGHVVTKQWVHKSDTTRYSKDAVEHCPKCGLFTMHPVNPLIEAIGRYYD